MGRRDGVVRESLRAGGGYMVEGCAVRAGCTTFASSHCRTVVFESDDR
jgi:hypothetical protein